MARLESGNRRTKRGHLIRTGAIFGTGETERAVVERKMPCFVIFVLYHFAGLTHIISYDLASNDTTHARAK